MQDVISLKEPWTPPWKSWLPVVVVFGVLQTHPETFRSWCPKKESSFQFLSAILLCQWGWSTRGGHGNRIWSTLHFCLHLGYKSLFRQEARHFSVDIQFTRNLNTGPCYPNSGKGTEPCTRPFISSQEMITMRKWLACLCQYWYMETRAVARAKDLSW